MGKLYKVGSQHPIPFYQLDSAEQWDDFPNNSAQNMLSLTSSLPDTRVQFLLGWMRNDQLHCRPGCPC